MQQNQLDIAVADAVMHQMDFLLELMHSGSTPVLISCGHEEHYCFSDEMIRLGWIERLPDPPKSITEDIGVVKVVRLRREGGVAYCTQFIEGDPMIGPVTEMVRAFFKEHQENLKEWLEKMREEVLGQDRMN